MKPLEKFAGVYCAIVTPLNQGRFDPKRFQKHIQTLVADGCDGLLVLGTTGEGPSFDFSERGEVISAALEACGPMTVLAGTGCAGLPDTIRATQQAYALGAHGVVLVPPFFFPNVTTAGLVEYFHRVFDDAVPARGGAFLYHIPQVTGIPIPFELLSELQDAVGEKLAGVKDSSGERANLLGLCQRFPGLRIFAGVDDLILDGLRAGAAGCITAEANMLAAPAAALYREFRTGGDPQPLQDLLAQGRVVLPHTPYPVALKGLLAQRYGDAGWGEVRPPLVALDAQDQDELAAGLRRLDLL